jgi:4-amino-4-deoxy-L-arabinose transferase-like glycosyltransferase
MTAIPPVAAAPRRDLAWLLPLVLLLVDLGGTPLFDVDEGAFATATREMLASGDWLSVTLNGLPRFDKPILIYWLQAASVAVLGFSEWSVRLPSALAAAAWCWVTCRFAREHFGASAATVALTVAATSIGVLVIGRAATADALLNLLLTAAALDGYRYLGTRARRPLRRAYLWVALGLLAKGPIAVLVPGAALALYAVASRRRADRLDALWRALGDGRGWLILIAVALPWYVAALWVHGQAFIDGFLMKHNVERALSPLQGHRGFAGYQLVATLALLLPWSVALLGAAAGIRRDWDDDLKRFLWLWFLFVLAFFSLVSTKLPHYMLYGTTPLFLLVALRVRQWAGGVRRQRALLLAPPLLLLALLPLLPRAVAAQAAATSGTYVGAMLARAHEVASQQHFALKTLAAFALAVVLAFALRRAPLVLAGALAALTALCMITVVSPYAGEILQGPIRRAVEVARARPETVVLWHFPAPSFSAYLGRVTPPREPAPGELALTRIGQVPADIAVEELFREGGVLLVKRIR